MSLRLNGDRNFPDLIGIAGSIRAGVPYDPAYFDCGCGNNRVFFEEFGGVDGNGMPSPSYISSLML